MLGTNYLFHPPFILITALREVIVLPVSSKIKTEPYQSNLPEYTAITQQKRNLKPAHLIPESKFFLPYFNIEIR